MPIREAVYAIAFLVGVFLGPIGYCFYKDRLDILDAARSILLKQKTTAMTSVIEFRSLDRVVRGGPTYFGKNDDVLNLMYPKRYWFNGLAVITHVSALTATFALVAQLLAVKNGEGEGFRPGMRNGR